MRIFVFNTKKIKYMFFLFFAVIALVLFSGMFSSQIVEVLTKTSSYLPIYSVDTKEKKVSITFDCAWGANDIQNILDALEKEKVKASFFLVGKWIDKYPAESKAIASGGHDIGNHSDAHLKMSQLSAQSIKNDLTAANNKIEKITGQKCLLFRAPYGDYDEKLIKSAIMEGQYAIQWDVDSLDWKNISTENICQRVMNKVKNGSIILLHNDTKYTAKALPTLIKMLKNEGYKFVPVSELIYRENYYMDYEGRQYSK